MLKFRLPYGPGKSKYFDGRVFLPIWGPQTTTETRLITEDHTLMREFDNTEYEQQMFHFNKIDRVQYYHHPYSAPGICHCFDCVCEVVVVMNYFEFAKKQYLGTKLCRQLHRTVRNYIQCGGDVRQQFFTSMSGLLSNQCSSV
jgi:hypothetical protein